MMRDLDEIRAEIDEIDASLVELFERRMHAAADVAAYKKANGLPVLNSARESQVIDKAILRLTDKTLSDQTAELMTSLMDTSKLHQLESMESDKDDYVREPLDKSAKVAYQGVEGSFSSQAAQDFFGAGVDSIPYNSFVDVFEAIDKGVVKYGVLPLENSTIGSVVEVYDLLGKYDMHVVGEQWVAIEHELVAVKGATIDGIKKVFSKAEALSQCLDYLGDKGWELIPYANTASAAKMVAQAGDKTLAAVASRNAAKLYGLTILQSAINSVSGNFTRFIVIAKHLTDDVADKITISFSVANERGSLYRVLGVFARLGINMSKIESRPDKNNPAKYYFVVDLEGNCTSKRIKCALAAVKSTTNDFKLLGEYRKGNF